MERFRHLWARVATPFDNSDTARVHNLQLAAERIDRFIWRAGEVFSFNRVVGSRQVPETNFQPAPVLTDRGRVRAPGGGVCQVSSTLYAATLRTDLQIVERHAHAIPVAYLPPGEDATVSGQHDLKLRNPHRWALQIRAQIRGQRLQVEIWGTQPCPRRPVRVDRFLQQCLLDRRSALIVSVWRVFADSIREKVSEDVYYLNA